MAQRLQVRDGPASIDRGRVKTHFARRVGSLKLGQGSELIIALDQ